MGRLASPTCKLSFDINKKKGILYLNLKWEMSMKNAWFFEIIAGMVFFVFMWIISAIFIDKERAIKAAENANYSEIKIVSTGVVFIGLRGCSANDAKMVKVEAKNMSGKEVKFTVCIGFFKGATIRH